MRAAWAARNNNRLRIRSRCERRKERKVRNQTWFREESYRGRDGVEVPLGDTLVRRAHEYLLGHIQNSVHIMFSFLGIQKLRTHFTELSNER